MLKTSVLIALVGVIAATGCSPSESVSTRIAAEARKAESFELVKLTRFTWDRAFVFSPYSMRDHVCRTLPASWTQCAGVVPMAVDEGSYFLAFVQEGKVVHHEFHPRPNGEFCTSGCVLQLTPQDARFKVASSGSGIGRKRLIQER